MYLATTNAHPRDSRIELIDSEIRDEKTGKVRRQHYYLIDGEKITSSVSSLLSTFCPNQFNASVASKGNVQLQKQWKRTGRDAAAFGTMHHEQFERFLDQPSGLSYEEMLRNFRAVSAYPMFQSYTDLPAWNHFCAFMNSIPAHWQPYRVEWRIFSNDAKLPGTIDLVMRHTGYPNELVLMVVDYKINKDPLKVFCKCGAGQTAKAREHKDSCSAVFGHPLTRNLLDNKVNKASLQVAVYSKILEFLYGARVIEGLVAYLHPDTVAPYIHHVKLEKFKPLAAKMIASRISK